MTITVYGVLHGKTIELDEDLGAVEGQKVEVQVKMIPASGRKLGEGLIRTEGALANDEEWDGLMEEIYRARKSERRPQVPNLGTP